MIQKFSLHLNNFQSFKPKQCLSDSQKCPWFQPLWTPLIHAINVHSHHTVYLPTHNHTNIKAHRQSITLCPRKNIYVFKKEDSDSYRILNTIPSRMAWGRWWCASALRWPQHYLTAMSWPSTWITRELSFVDDVVWSVVTAVESVALLSMFCFFFLFCGCTV